MKYPVYIINDTINEISCWNFVKQGIYDKGLEIFINFYKILDSENFSA